MQIMRFPYSPESDDEEDKGHGMECQMKQFGESLPFMTKDPIDEDGFPVDEQHSDDHERWMIIELSIGVLVPRESSLICPHPNGHQQDTHSSETLRDAEESCE